MGGAASSKDGADILPEFPLPDTKTKRHIFKLHTSRMSLSDDVDLEELVMAKDDLSGADIKAVCSELRA